MIGNRNLDWLPPFVVVPWGVAGGLAIGISFGDIEREPFAIAAIFVLWLCGSLFMIPWFSSK